MPKYLFGSHVYSPEHESWQRILQKGTQPDCGQSACALCKAMDRHYT